MDRRNFLRDIGIGGAITAPAAGIAVATGGPPAIKPAMEITAGLPIEDRPWKRTVVICGVEYSYHIFEEFAIPRMEFDGPFNIKRDEGGPVIIETSRHYDERDFRDKVRRLMRKTNDVPCLGPGPISKELAFMVPIEDREKIKCACGGNCSVYYYWDRKIKEWDNATP